MTPRKILITLSIGVLLFIAAIAFYNSSSPIKMAGHSMSKEDHAKLTLNSNSDTNTNVLKDSINFNDSSADKDINESIQASSSDTSNLKVNGLEDADYVNYVVKSDDTLWKISRTYTPSYKAYDDDNGNSGIITLIALKNNLKKSNDGRYVIYSGQKLTIPKEKNIALNSTINSSKPISKVTTSNNDNKITSTNTSTPKSNTTTSNTPDISTTPSNPPPVDHSAHMSH